MPISRAATACPRPCAAAPTAPTRRTAITEIATRLAAVHDANGGESIFFYGGGAQGTHMPGVYAQSTLAAIGVRYRSNALAQEKTGEA